MEIDLQEPDPILVDQALSEILDYKYGDTSFDFKHYQRTLPLWKRVSFAMKHNAFALIAGTLGTLAYLLYQATLTTAGSLVLPCIILVIGAVVATLIALVHSGTWLFKHLYGHDKHALIPKKVTYRYCRHKKELYCIQIFLQVKPDLYGGTRTIIKERPTTVNTLGLLTDPRFNLEECLKAADKGYKKHLKTVAAEEREEAQKLAKANKNLVLIETLGNQLTAHGKEVVARNTAAIEVHSHTTGMN